MKTHLRYSMLEASLEHNEHRHPQVVMAEFGINYSHSTPQSMGDQWWFWNCENLPDPLPGYLNELKVDPHKAVGFGLSKEMAEEIERINAGRPVDPPKEKDHE